MSEALVGTQAARELYVEQNGSPLPGLSDVTYSLVGPTGAVLYTTAATTEVSSSTDPGWYRLTLLPTDLAAPGLYRETWASLTQGLFTRHATFLVADPVGPLLQRYELRQQVAQLLNDLTLGQATGGAGNTLLDTGRTEPDDDWRGAWLYLYGGPGRGQERTVSAFTKTTGTFTVGKTWLTTPTANTFYSLHRRFSTDAYNRALNLVIAECAPRALFPVIDETLLQTGGVFEYTVPAGFTYLSDVWQLNTADAAATWTRLAQDHGRLDRPPDYRVLPGRRLLRLQTPQTGYRLRLIGQMQPELLLRDGAYCDAPPEYVIFRAAAHLATSVIHSPGVDRDAAAQVAQLFHAQAQSVRPNVLPLPGSLRL